MKDLLRLNLICALAIYSFSTLHAENTLVDFKEISLDEALLKGQKIFISFSAEWCLPCKMMDESLFNDHEIASLLNANFVAIKADVDSYSGNAWNELYNANYLPTTLFASEKGNELNRFNGIPTKQEFIASLKSIIATDRFVSIPIRSNYGVQIGAFSNPVNAQKLIYKVEKANFKNAVVFEESNEADKIIYKVVLSNYKTRQVALQDLKFIKEKGFDGFVRKL